MNGKKVETTTSFYIVIDIVLSVCVLALLIIKQLTEDYCIIEKLTTIMHTILVIMTNDMTTTVGTVSSSVTTRAVRSDGERSASRRAALLSNIPTRFIITDYNLRRGIHRLLLYQLFGTSPSYCHIH